MLSVDQRGVANDVGLNSAVAYTYYRINPDLLYLTNPEI